MENTTHKVEKEEFHEEMTDSSPAILAVVKQEPMEMCIDEEPILEPIPSQSVPDVESTQVETALVSGTTEMEDDREFWPFTGKPLFHLILGKSHVSASYTMSIPAKIVKQLPPTTVPVVMRYCGKNWDMVYLGRNKAKRFDCAGWKAFVIDNKLKAGYGCFFELSESSRTIIKFRVQVIRTDGILPSLSDDDEVGDTPEKPIIVD